MNTAPNTSVDEVTHDSANSNIPLWRRFINSLLAAEISVITRYFDQLIHLSPLPGDSGVLFNSIDAPKKSVAYSVEELREPDTSNYRAILLNGNFNSEFDIEGLLRSLYPRLSRHDRVIAILYNPYLGWLYRLANKFGFREGEQPSTFVTETDLRNMAKLAGFEVVRLRPTSYIPHPLFGIGTFLNRFIASVPFIRRFGSAWVVALRPQKHESKLPSLSIVIPARNEKGNIESALTRMPNLGIVPEIIFVEGHSSDNTWEEIQRVAAAYSDKFPIQIMQQTGKGKADAVRLGFSKATGDILTILDADLTMPPELLGRFYEAWCTGKADFVNGNRLVYPMEGQAMKFLNWLGNIFFAKALSFVLDSPLGDSLCGTKLMTKRDYARFGQWRNDFGDFDPFGDFELLFPAASLALGIVDVPIRYRDRTYGSTNIRRFYHGMMLFKMTAIGYLRLRFGQPPAKDA